MQDVKTVKLGEICETHGGGTPSREVPDYFGGDILWITPTEIPKDRIGKIEGSRETLTRKGLANCSAKLLPIGAVLMTSRASIGNIGIADVPVATNQGFVSFICGPSVQNTYLAYFLLNSKSRFENAANGATFKEIAKGAVREFKIPLPALDTQRHIAAVLDRADALRQKDRQLLACYEQLAQSVFLDMFGDEKVIVDTYEPVNLREVTDIVSGVTKNAKHTGADYIDVPYMRVANVQDGWIDLTEIKTVSVPPSDLQKYRLAQNDILLTEGGDPDKLGRGCVWHNEIADCIHQNHIFRVRPNRQVVNATFLSFLISSRYGKRYFLKEAKQTTGIASINMQQLKRFPAVVPPLVLQTEFARRVAAIEQQKATVHQQLAASESLFQSLLQRYFG